MGQGGQVTNGSCLYTVSTFVDGVRHDGDPRTIVLTSRKHVSLQVGRPLASPPMYDLQN